MVQMQRRCQGNRRVLLQMCSEAHTPDIHIASLPLHLNTSVINNEFYPHNTPVV